MDRPGFGSGLNTIGFDCSSVVQNAWQQGAGLACRESLLRRQQPWRIFRLERRFARGPAFLPRSGRPPRQLSPHGHLRGNGNMVHVPLTGMTVEVVHDICSNPYYAARFALATRPGTDTGVAIGAHG
jgi:cell wall-associated NlpC family hydrolase